MEIYHSLDGIKKPPAGTVVTIGVFDGVHRGHAHIIRSVVRRAKELRAKSVVLTFYPHPHVIIHPAGIVPLLISLEHRLRLLERLGVDIILVMKFSPSVSSMKAEEFVTKVLLDKLGMKEVFLGADFTFGRRRSGDIPLLKSLSRRN